MSKKWMYVLYGCIVALVLFLVWGRSSKITNYPQNEGPIVAFGDSLVYGYGATADHNFIALLSQKVGEPIVNLGVPGNTTEQALARIDQVLEQKPRITLVLLGGNDFLQKVDRTQTFDRLKQIILRIQQSGSVVILLGVRGGLLVDSVDGLYEGLAHETHSAYVSNVLDGLFGDARYMSDAVHPNDVGYAKIADRVFPVLHKLMQ